MEHQPSTLTRHAPLRRNTMDVHAPQDMEDAEVDELEVSDCPWPTEGESMHWTCHHRASKHQLITTHRGGEGASRTTPTSP